MKWPTIVAILGGFAIGGFYQYYTSTIDHPVEQFVEHFLSSHGIHVDFSKDKKQQRDKSLAASDVKKDKK